jgi:hypothetical protein
MPCIQEIDEAGPYRFTLAEQQDANNNGDNSGSKYYQRFLFHPIWGTDIFSRDTERPVDRRWIVNKKLCGGAGVWRKRLSAMLSRHDGSIGLAASPTHDDWGEPIHVAVLDVLELIRAISR